MNKYLDARAQLLDKVVVLPVRFNMLHRGHEAYIKAVLGCGPRAVYIFLGRSNAFRIETDPFDDVERRCMIESFAATLSPSDAEKLHIFPIFNRKVGAIEWSTAEVSTWYGYCANLLLARGLPRWDVVISGNSYTDSYSGDIVFISPYDLVRREDQVYVDDDVPVFATRVRQLLYAQDESWTRYVSEQTACIVRETINSFPMAQGPVEGIRHLVRVAGIGIDEQSFCLVRSVEDGQFKDRIAVEALHGHFNCEGVSARLAASSRVPYEITGQIDRKGEEFLARVSLRSVKPNVSGDLEYQFEFCASPAGSETAFKDVRS